MDSFAHLIVDTVRRRYVLIGLCFLCAAGVVTVVSLSWPDSYRASSVLRVGTVAVGEPVVDAPTTATECSLPHYRDALKPGPGLSLRCEAIYRTDLVRVVGNGGDPQAVERWVQRLAQMVVSEQNLLIHRIHQKTAAGDTLSRPAVVVTTKPAAQPTKPGFKSFAAMALFLGGVMVVVALSFAEAARVTVGSPRVPASTGEG